RRLRRHDAGGRRRPHHDRRGRPRLAAAPDRHPHAARAGAGRDRPRLRQPDPRGADEQLRCPGPLPAVRLRAGRRAPRLLPRDPGGRPGDVGQRHRHTRVRGAPRRHRARGPGPHDRRRGVAVTPGPVAAGSHPPHPAREARAVGDRILAIETSCDETAAAVVERATHVRSSVVASQIDRHARYGGVVPEIASRAHVEMLVPVVAEALVEAGVADDEIDAVAATVGPGLVGSLLVGVSAAKALALVWDVPFVAVNHLEGHLYAAFLEEPDLELPVVVLLVSGGHTLLVHMEDHGRYRLLGSTIDDAAGEAFDKVARFLGLGYPGGPVIDRIAREGDPHAIAFPRAMPDRPYDFSFSGLKTAVVNHVRRHPEVDTADVAASFQEAVVDVLVAKARRAAQDVG